MITNVTACDCHMLALQISLSQVDYNLTEYKIQFLRVICNHEHYVQLNLPLKPSLMPVIQDESPSPPGSLGSGLDEVGLSAMDFIAELSPEFRQHHYLSGLILGELSVILDSKCVPIVCSLCVCMGHLTSSHMSVLVHIYTHACVHTSTHHHLPYSYRGNKLREQAVEMLRDLVAAHDNDIRYSSSESRKRIATIYFPLLPIVMQHYNVLFKDKDPAGDSGFFDRSGDYRRSVIIHNEDKVSERCGCSAIVHVSTTPYCSLLCGVWCLEWRRITRNVRNTRSKRY